jgi:hypothetical protein
LRAPGFPHVSPSAEACTFDQSIRSSEPFNLHCACPSRPALYYSICWPVRQLFILRLIPVGPSVEALQFTLYQSAPPWRLCTALSTSRPLRGDCVHFLLASPSVEALHCTFYQSAPPWSLCAALSISRPLRGGFVLRFPVSRPLRGGFVLHFKSVGPSVEALCCIFSQSAPPWWLCTAFQVGRPLRGGFVLHFKSVGPSVEALCCLFSQSALPWRLCTAFQVSQPLRGGFVYCISSQ